MAVGDRGAMSTPRDRVLSDRLICERLRSEHALELIAHLRDPRVARWVWAKPELPTELEIIEGLAAKVAHWEQHGFGLWLLRDRATGEMVGRGGLQQTFVASVHEVEVGWSIVPERWGEGLATELALTSISVAFDDLRLPEVVAFTLPDNIASRRVMEKASFTYEREIQHAGLPHVLYRRGPGAA